MIRAYAHPHDYGDSVAISIVMRPAEDCGPVQILRLSTSSPPGPFQVRTWEDVKQGEITEPTFVLDDASARAVLDALTRLYQGAEDTRALRRDYDAERKRVDQLTAAMSTLALKLAEPDLTEPA